MENSASHIPGFVISLVTSGVMSAAFSGYLSAQREERELLRAKLEELDMAVTRFCELKEREFPMCLASGDSWTLKIGKLDSEEKKECTDAFNKVRLIIKMYFPELDESLNRLYKTMDEAKTGFMAPGAEFKRYAVDRIERATESWEYDEAHMHSEISKLARAKLYSNWFSVKHVRALFRRGKSS